MKKWIAILIMLCLYLIPIYGEEKYYIGWRFDPGLLNVSRQKIKILHQRFWLRKDRRRIYKTLLSNKVTLHALVYWTVAKVDKNSQALINIYHRKGRIYLIQGSRRYSCEIENPRHARRIQQHIFKPYFVNVKDGMAFLIDLKNKRVLNSWKLIQVSLPSKTSKFQEKVRYKREPSKIRDPFHMEDSFKQLPGKEVPVGYSWKRTRRFGMYHYEYEFKFSKVLRIKGTKVAKIDIKGTIRRLDKKKVGTTKGMYFYDIMRRIIILRKIKEKIKNIYPKRTTNQNSKRKENKEIGGVLERIERDITIELLHSNAKKIK